VLASVAGEVAVVAIDHRQAGAPCSGRVRRWRCRHAARRSQRCAADRRCGGTARSRPQSVRASNCVVEVVHVEVAAAFRGEEKR
jgi:hypothetical protein